jgi:hypothetical protein
MKTLIAFAFLVLLAGLGFAQSAEEYCSAERAEGESCYRSCCESLGYSWVDGGCNVAESEQDSVTGQCGYCTDTYMQCVAYYEQGGASGAGAYSGESSSGSSGCCGSAMVLLAVPLLAAFRR